MNGSRPKGNNADEWHLFLSKWLDNRATFPNGMTFVAVQIAKAIDDAERRAIASARPVIERAALQSADSLDLGPDWRAMAEKLADALEPFGAVANDYPDLGDEASIDGLIDGLTFGDIRRASAALADYRRARG